MSAQVVYEDSQTRILELLGSGDVERIEAMLVLYSQLFPEYKHYTARMRRRAALPVDARPGHIAHYWLIEVDGKPAGMTTFRFIYRRNCGLGVSVGLDRSVRSVMVEGERLSSFIMAETLRQFARDKKSMGGTDLLGMVTEVEHRELMEHYKQFGMLELPVDYFEPIFAPNGHHPEEPTEPASYKPVILGFMPSPEASMDWYDCTTLTDFALAFLVDHYGLSEDNRIVNTVVESIHNG